MNMNIKKVKKALAVTLGAAMMLQSGAFAADVASEANVYTRPEVTSVTCNQVGKNFVYVTIETANSEADQPVIAYMVKDDVIYGLEYSVVLDDASTIKVGASDTAPTGTYTVNVALNRVGDVATSEIYYVGSNDVDGMFETLNLTSDGATTQTVVDKMDVYSVALSVVNYTGNDTLSNADYAAMTDEQKAIFAELILSGVNEKFADLKGSLDESNSENLLKEAYILAVYNAESSTPAQVATTLYRFDDTVGFDSKDANLYAKIQKTAEMAKAAKTILPEAESVADIAAVVEKAAAVELLNETHWRDRVDIIADNNSIFDISVSELNYIQKTNSRTSTMCEKINELFYSIDAVKAAWDAGYEEITEASTTGGGGGGGGGGTVTTIVADSNLVGATSVATTKKITDYYDDMTGYDWANDYVLHLTENGIVAGYGEKKFGPAKSLTRAEFMKMLVNACGLADVTATSSFTDVDKNAWYYIYVASAEKAGLATGYGNGLFGVNDGITREDVVTLLYRAAKIKGLPVTKYSVGALNLTDSANIASYAVEAVQALYGAGVYLDTANPKSVTEFEPKKQATRAYVAVLLDQIYTLK